MNKDHSQFQKKLADERNVLISELKGISVQSDKQDKDNWEAIPGIEVDEADSNEVGDRISQYEGNTALVTELEARLKELDLASNKIKAGKFGTCEVCGKNIEEDRLGANPAARTCKTHIETHLPAPVL
jgi:DnaK suppressor protein